MLAPGCSFTAAGRLNALASAGPTAIVAQGGIGFDAAGNVLIDTNAVAGTKVDQGIAVNATNCLYGTTTAAGTDFFVNGLRLSATGQLVYAQANPALVSNGNPLSATGAMCVA